MELPIRLADLPAPLAALVTQAEQEGLWGDAIDGFEDWLDESSERPAPVLVMLAFMLYRDALEVMVDEVEERGKQALALLAEAKQPKSSALVREISRAVARDSAYTKQHAKEVEKTREQPLESLTRQQVRDLAYKLGESSKPEEQIHAGRAWLRAAELATEDYDRRDCLARAALQFADGGDWAEAMPRLEQLVKDPSQHEGWQVDYAWYRLLDKAIADGGPALFAKRWADALAMEREDPFPFARPMQEKYLAYALDNELPAIAKHVASVATEHRSPRERKPIQALLDRASKLR